MDLTSGFEQFERSPGNPIVQISGNIRFPR